MHARRLSGPSETALKWRGVTLDRFDGVGWRKSDRRRSPLRPSPENVFEVSEINGDGNEVEYEVLLEPLATTALFGPHQLREVSGRVQGLERDSDNSVFMRFQSLRRVQYTVRSEVARARVAAFRSHDVRRADSAQFQRYLQLPLNLAPQMAALASRIVDGATDPGEMAEKMETYLRNNYQYTLNLNWAPGNQPISTFLFQEKSGHCEYFASSMAILLRTVGVPTRIVNGFLMGEYNQIGRAHV